MIKFKWCSSRMIKFKWCSSRIQAFCSWICLGKNGNRENYVHWSWSLFAGSSYKGVYRLVFVFLQDVFNIKGKWPMNMLKPFVCSSWITISGVKNGRMWKDVTRFRVCMGSYFLTPLFFFPHPINSGIYSCKHSLNYAF